MFCDPRKMYVCAGVGGVFACNTAAASSPLLASSLMASMVVSHAPLLDTQYARA